MEKEERTVNYISYFPVRQKEVLLACIYALNNKTPITTEYAYEIYLAICEEMGLEASDYFKFKSYVKIFVENHMFEIKKRKQEIKILYATYPTLFLKGLMKDNYFEDIKDKSSKYFDYLVKKKIINNTLNERPKSINYKITHNETDSTHILEIMWRVCDKNKIKLTELREEYRKYFINNEFTVRNTTKTIGEYKYLCLITTINKVLN